MIPGRFNAFTSPQVLGDVLRAAADDASTLVRLKETDLVLPSSPTPAPDGHFWDDEHQSWVPWIRL